MTTPDILAKVVDALNDVAPDTFDEGENGPWRFTTLERAGDTWTLSFECGPAAGSVTFPFAGECGDAYGVMDSEWYEQAAMPALFAWEDEVQDPELIDASEGVVHVTVTAEQLEKRRQR